MQHRYQHDLLIAMVYCSHCFETHVNNPKLWTLAEQYAANRTSIEYFQANVKMMDVILII